MATGDINDVYNKHRTRQERVASARKAGKASGVARKRQKTIREAFAAIRNLPVKDATLKKQLEDMGVEGDPTYAAAIAYALVYHALKGNSQMARLALEAGGEDAALLLKARELALKERELDLREKAQPTPEQVDATVVILPPKDA